jgi:hypothetical protein
MSVRIKSDDTKVDNRNKKSRLLTGFFVITFYSIVCRDGKVGNY